MGRVILIAGAARSGTSALAGALGVCGVELGSNHLPANRYNPKGYCELAKIISLHDRCLDALDRAWDSVSFLPDGWQNSEAAGIARKKIREVITLEFAGKDLWAVKDARLCPLLPLWIDEFPEQDLRVIVPLRHPFEVAHSLARFNGKSWTESLLYWLFTLFESERNTRQLRRVQTTYAELLSDPVALMHRIEGALDVSFPCPAAERFANLKAWVEPGMCRFKPQHPSPSEPGLESLKALAHSVYHQFVTDNLMAHPTRVDSLFEQCFGATYLSLATALEKKQRRAEKARHLLQTRMNSAEAWIKGPWLQQAFHRWNDPSHPRARLGFGDRLAN